MLSPLKNPEVFEEPLTDIVVASFLYVRSLSQLLKFSIYSYDLL